MLKLDLSNCYYTIILSPKFMLLLANKNLLFKKKNGTIHVFITFSFSYSKIVLKVLNKLIVFYMKNTII